MIASMLKYTILCHHLEYNEFLDKLYELGVVHIIEKNKDEVESYKKNILNIQLYEKSLKKIAQDRNVEESEEGELEIDKDILDYVEEMEEKLSGLEKQKDNLQKNIDLYNTWQNFDLENINKLKELGIQVKFYQCSIKKFKKEWQEEYPLEIINNDNTSIYFVFLNYNESEISFPAKEIKIPDKPLAAIKQELQDINNQIEEINKELNHNISKALSILNKQIKDQTKNLDFQYVQANSERITDEKIMLLEGWVPESDKNILNDYLDKSDTVYFSEKPTKDDNIPVLLKNSRFAKLFEPISNLFALPDYKEIDLTPFLAPFFMLFFGFCVGDTGYGLLILIGTLIYRRKASKTLKPILSLAAYLGSATIIMGLISGTFFGINLIEIKSYPLRDIILEPLNLFWLAIGIGGVQIFYGMIIKAANQIKQYGFKYGLSTIGWIFLIINAGGLIGLKQIGIENEMLSLIFKIGFAIGGCMILFFANPDKNIIISIFSGLYNVYNVLISIFGDLLSYIRLFALGISSSILGLVFNQIAIQFIDIGIIGWLLFIIILLIGHGLNIFMACLGAFVHPMRLTFVEFYKNAGFTGGGKQYKPFSK